MPSSLPASLIRYQGSQQPKKKPPRPPSHWNRSNCIGVAKVSCNYCLGNGMRLITNGGRGRKEVPCNCVFRAVFRACFNRYRECVIRGEQISPVTLQSCHGRDGRRVYSRKREEYMADFFLVSRRVLEADLFKLFSLHFLRGFDWKICCEDLRMERGNFFHEVYVIEQKLGRVFAELEPYALFPLDEYFSGMVHRAPDPTYDLRRVIAA